ncbi:MAG TPA: hypothetical protein VK066_24270 [Chloroflexota bacterium]|nr:hypothetical protein [Chloroflexota bacterium]
MPRDADEQTTAKRSTVGSLYGAPQGEARPVGADEPEGLWVIRGGRPFHGGGQGFDPEGVEQLDYSNPHGLNIERVWFDGKIVFASESGELDIDPSVVKVAQEYQIVYDVQLDARGKLVRPATRVPNQFNIYDSIPGMAKYSPIWQFNYVVVPRSYVPNTLRSEADCLRSGYRIVRSNVFEN